MSSNNNNNNNKRNFSNGNNTRSHNGQRNESSMSTSSSNWQETPRKQNKYNNRSKYNHNKNGSFNNKLEAESHDLNNNEVNSQLMANANESTPTSLATVPTIAEKASKANHQSFVPSLSAEHSINDSLPSDDSIILNGCHSDGANSDCGATSSTSSSSSSSSSTSTSASNVSNDDNQQTNECEPSKQMASELNDTTSSSVLIQQTYQPQQQNHMHQFDQSQCNCSPYFTELSCNTSGVYTTPNPYVPVDPYEYHNGFQQSQFVPQQQASPYYVYQNYPSVDFASPQVGAVSNGLTQPNSNSSFYAGYQNMPQTYGVYDPNMSAYGAPWQQQQPPPPPPSIPQQIQTTPQAQSSQTGIMSSPQHQSTLLASYQTPPPQQNQLYISTSNSLSSQAWPSSSSTNNVSSATTSCTNIAQSASQSSTTNDLSNLTQTTATTSVTTMQTSPSPSSALNEQTLASNCNSPQQTMMQQQQSMYPSPYIYYHTSPPMMSAPPMPNPYLTPQSFQSPMQSTPPFLMYTQQMPQHVMPPMQVQPAPFMYPNNANLNTPPPSTMTKTNRYMNNGKYTRNYQNNRYNKKYQNNKSVSNGELTPQFPSSLPSHHQTNSTTLSCLNDEMLQVQTDLNDTTNTLLQDNQQTATSAMCSPIMCSPATTAASYDSTSLYYDPNVNPLLFQNIANGLPPSYDFAQMHGMNGEISSYGEYDENYDDEADPDVETEQLACYTCRGRRMCFCYFLKVRYYKFPSFFDLMDHQYKKMRSTMMKNKKQLVN